LSTWFRNPGAVILAAAIPLLFLHVSYQPGVAIGFGSTTINAYLSDFAVLAVVVAAVVSGVRAGFAPLRQGRVLWLAGTLLLAWIVIEVALGHLHATAYAWRTHGVTAAKFVEYALLAPSVPLLLRRPADAVLPVASLVLWSTFATAVGIAQFFGADIFLAGTVGRRQASFLASADFAALSTATLLVGIVALVHPRARRLDRALVGLALASGVLGMIVAGAIASVLGLATALVTLGVVLVVKRQLEVRRLLAVAAAGLVVLAGAVAIRGSDLDAFARFLGATPGHAQKETKVQTYAHRTLLAWIGWKIWLDHPLAGVGWEGSAEPVDFEPYLPAAHRHFPDEAPTAFPSAAPNRRYGVQNSWLQALADLGVVGLVLWLGVFAAAAYLAARAVGAAIGLYALLLVAMLVWLWTAQGFVAGIPLDALTWLAFGLAATAQRLPWPTD
jgi:O-antigen ligase